MRKKWFACEDAARMLIDSTREALGIARTGSTPQDADGAQWELDARIWREGPDGRLALEARRYTSPLKQDGQATCTWCLRDIGGTLVASQCPPPEDGVPKDAAIEQFLLTDDSTAGNYMAEFLNRRFPVATPPRSA